MYETLYTLTISVCVFAAELVQNFAPGWRVLQHTKVFLHTGKFPRSKRGGKREGHTLLDEEVFRSKASLWVKTQIALHTKRRLRAIRKSSGFKSQSKLPMEEKQTANVTSHTFQQYIENTLLAEFYSEEAVRSRARSVAATEGTDSTHTQEIYTHIHVSCLFLYP